jgi:hypothetical protein
MLVGRFAVWAGGGTGFRAGAPAALGVSGAVVPGGDPLGSALMMLTAGIDADDGKNSPLPGAALACGGDPLGGGVAGWATAGGTLAATGESDDCGHSVAWCRT